MTQSRENSSQVLTLDYLKPMTQARMVREIGGQCEDSVNKSLEIEAKLEKLRNGYASSLDKKIKAFAETVAELKNAGTRDGELACLLDLSHAAHQMTGTAGTYGFDNISSKARKLKDICEEILDVGKRVSDKDRNRIALIIEDLFAELPHLPDREAASKDNRSHQARSTYYLLTNDDEACADWQDQFSELGVTLDLFTDGDAFEKAIEAEPPTAAMISNEFKHWKQCMRRVKRRWRPGAGRAPIFCFADYVDFRTRLEALRAGATSCIGSDESITDIAMKIRSVATTGLEGTIKVLILEDANALGSQCTDALKGPGFQSESVSDPVAVIDTLRSFDPEILVSDTKLKSCTGFEVAQILDWFVDRKKFDILFLTPGQRFNKESSKLGLSSDCFLGRPFENHELRTRIAEKAHRLRQGIKSPDLKRLMDICSDAQSLNRVHELLNWQGQPLPEPERRTETTQKTRGPTILVVEDDIYLAGAISAHLQVFGVEVVEAYSGLEGIQMAGMQPPDLIISDYLMPNGSGEYLLARLKADPLLSDIPVIIITGHKVEDGQNFALERELAGRFGAKAFLTKPLDWNALFSKIANYVDLPSSGRAVGNAA